MSVAYPRRRDWLVGAPLLLHSIGAATQGAGATSKPAWLGFGLNAGQEAEKRFPLALDWQRTARAQGTDVQLQVAEAIGGRLRQAAMAEIRDQVQIDEGLLLGAVLDYENVLTARLGSSNFLLLHLVGHGLVLSFKRNVGWKLQSSFPFPVILLRESTGPAMSRSEASRYMTQAFVGPEKSFASSFVDTAKRFSPRWRDVGSGYYIRVESSTVQPTARDKLASWGIANNISAVWLGHIASAAACAGLAVPVLPFEETHALGNFSMRFSETLVAQDIRMPSEDAIDLRVHVALRNVARDMKFRNQLQRWEIYRQVVIDVKVVGDTNDEVVSFRAGYQDDIPDSVVQQEDNSPARDAHFFDMAIYRCLEALFSAIAKRDEAALEKLFIKPDAALRSRMDNFRSRYQRAI